ncbi:histidine ammonia-lyase [Saxibacter everestensis]|uniref:Histidine ammonia-lyase n=1 Tax=Saxibacter everestensis TaxID=2909229 RepID=A0ABY8QW59_9MICO|nr:histidine ammonia-lyase [Brevibacteriaceae bacterium ZFBP1038]
MHKKKTVAVGIGAVSEEDLINVARKGYAVELAEDAQEAIREARHLIDRLSASDTPVYGVSTGFGALATTHIPSDKRAELQRRLIRSHAAGSGAEVETEVVRALMLLRLSTLATGHTGVRLTTAQAYAALLSAGITPIVYEYGSLGCSGDLAPLAHVALALIGEGQARNANGELLEGAEVLSAAGIEPVVLAEKEGLALINGTDGMLGTLVLALDELDALAKEADLAAAMTLEALLGTDRPFEEHLVALRPQPGQALSAANVRAVLKDSSIIEASRGPQTYRIQDAYSIRCHPQVAGAVRDTIDHARRVAGYELAAAIDNPVIADGEIESNGNFHGAPVGYVLDFLAIAIADLASISERRTDRLLDKARSHGLPPFLAYDAGVDSGGMITQYTAAGIVSELKRLAVPASVDSIPSSAMQEDHVSMGWSAARKLRRSVDGLRRVISIELMNAAKALDIRREVEHMVPGPVTSAVIAKLRETVEGPGPDRFASPEIAAVVASLESGAVLDAAAKAGAKLV